MFKRSNTRHESNSDLVLSIFTRIEKLFWVISCQLCVLKAQKLCLHFEVWSVDQSLSMYIWIERDDVLYHMVDRKGGNSGD